MPLPATIRTSVSQDAIRRVTRLFNGTLADCLAELFQNARRADATRVDIDWLDIDDARVMRVGDNGCGIDDPAVLVTLGRSGWGDMIAASEDPAGMGVFSLAGRKVEIHSFSRAAGRGWKVVIGAGAWETATPLTIETSDIAVGTDIFIELPDAWRAQTDVAIAMAARHYPVDVHVHGVLQPRVDFLAGAETIEIVEGCRVGVCLGAPTHDGEHQVNFHGVTVRCRLPRIKEIDSRSTWAGKIDIVDAPALQLVLPARKEMVENAALANLRVAAEIAIYRAIAATGHHRLKHADWSRARDLGVELPEAEAWLPAWHPSTADMDYVPEGEPVTTQAMAIMPGLTPDLQQVTALALGKGAPLGHRLVGDRPGLAGYRWYDRLPRITSIDVAIARDGATWRYDAEEPVLPAVASGPVDTLDLRVTLGRDDRLDDVHLFPIDALVCDNDACGDLDGAVIFVRKGVAISPGALADLIERSVFCADDDSDSDSRDTQRRRFELRARELATTLLLGPEEALLERIRTALWNEVLWLIPDGRRIELSASRVDQMLNLLSVPPAA